MAVTECIHSSLWPQLTKGARGHRILTGLRCSMASVVMWSPSAQECGQPELGGPRDAVIVEALANADLAGRRRALG